MPTRPPSAARALLREKNFARLLVARLVSAFGSAMAPIALAFGVLDLTGSASQMGLVIAAQTAAVVLFQLLGGALADRGSRQKQMARADLLAMASQGTMAWLFLSGQADIPLLIGLMALNGLALAFHGPSATGLVPQVVERDDLQAANALLGMAQSGSLALGAACGGVLVATVGAGWALVIDAGTFALSALCVTTLRPREQSRSAPSGILRDLVAGWDAFTAHRWLWTIVLQFSVVVAATEGTFAVLGPTVAKRMLGGASDWGWIAGAFGMGTLLGGVLALRIHVQRPMLVATFMVFAFALPSLLLSGPAPVFVIAAGACASGVCGQLFGVLWYTTLQTRVPPEALSRVSAYDHLGSFALAPLGMVGAGLLLEAIGSRTTLWIAAALIILPTLAVLGVREVRTLRTAEVASGVRG